MANNDVNMGWGDADEVPNGERLVTHAPAPRFRTVRTAVAREMEESKKERR